MVGQNNWTNDSLAANGTPIRIWNATNGQTIATCILKRQPDLAEERLAQMKVLWSPDSQHIVTWGLSGNFSVWNAQRGALVARYTQAWKDFRTQIVKNDKLIIVYDVGWSPDGKYLFWQGTIGDNSLKTTRVWSRDTGKQLGTLKIPDLEVSPFGLWSPDSQILAVPHNKKVTLWRVQDGSAVYTYEPGTYIEEFSWSPDGRHIATYEERELYGFQLALWEATTGKGRTIYTDSGPPDLGYLHWSPDGKLIAVASSGPIDIWQVQ